jgi:eukaryotic-like serine/threonine-protein kinase
MVSSWQGRVVDGRYTLEAMLGEGGMGVVYRARHALTGGEVALKLMHPHVAALPDVANRFLAEARAPAAIGHPGIVKVTDAGKTPDGELYLVMELLRGETLRQRLDRGRPPPELAFRYAARILDPLVAAHAAGIIHRDLKPENVFMVEDGALKLLDFGIAKVEAPGAAATATGSVMGTANYMSPEQLRDTSKVDQRADLWAVSVILFEALTGKRPFDGPSAPDVVVNILSKPAPPPSSAMSPCPPELDAFFARAFASDPAKRFASAAEMAAAVASLSPSSVVAHAQSAVALGPTTLASSVSSVGGAGAVASSPNVISVVKVPSGPAVPSTTMRSEYNPLLEAHPALLAPTLPPRKKLPTAAWIAIGLFGLVGASGAVALAISRFTGDPAPAPTQPPRHAASVASHPHAAGESDEALCERACEQLERCTAVSGSNCRAECVRNVEYRTCARPLHHADCKGSAMCAISVGCPGKLPQGHATCRQTAECEFSCNQHKVSSVACSCGCVHEMAPDRAIELAANNLCGVTYCATDCKAPANPLICGACMTQHCKAPNQGCLSH